MHVKNERDFLPLSAVDFHVLLVLSKGPCHGYGIMKAVESESGGALAPEIGSLYRMIARLTSDGLIEETAVADSGDGRGKPRRCYAITPLGLQVARSEARRLRNVLHPNWLTRLV